MKFATFVLIGTVALQGCNSLVPGPPSGVLLNTTGETSLALTWAPPTTGGSPVNYTLTINDSSSHVVIPDNGSPVYNYAFTGLTSNTPYSVSVMASNNGGIGNQTVVNNCTWAYPPGSVMVDILQGSDIDPSLNVTWTAVARVSLYLVFELGSVLQITSDSFLCLSSVCAEIINLQTSYSSGRSFTICVASYNIAGQSGAGNCTTKSGLGSAPGHGLAFLMPLLTVLLLVIAIIVICLIIIKHIITRKVKDSKNSAGELESMNLLRGNGRSYGTDR